MHRKFHLNISKSFFTMWVTTHWNRVPREVVESPLPEILKNCLNAVLCDALHWGMALLYREVGTDDPLWYLPTRSLLGFFTQITEVSCGGVLSSWFPGVRNWFSYALNTLWEIVIITDGHCLLIPVVLVRNVLHGLYRPEQSSLALCSRVERCPAQFSVPSPTGLPTGA